MPWSKMTIIEIERRIFGNDVVVSLQCMASALRGKAEQHSNNTRSTLQGIIITVEIEKHMVRSGTRRRAGRAHEEKPHIDRNSEVWVPRWRALAAIQCAIQNLISRPIPASRSQLSPPCTTALPAPNLQSHIYSLVRPTVLDLLLSDQILWTWRRPCSPRPWRHSR